MRPFYSGRSSAFRHAPAAGSLLLGSGFVLLLSAAVISGVSWATSFVQAFFAGARGPFVHGDVFFVYVAAMLPITALPVRHSARSLGPLLQVSAGCLLAVISWLIRLTAASGVDSAAPAEPASGAAIRLLISFTFAGGIQFLVYPLVVGWECRSKQSPAFPDNTNAPVRWLVFSAAMLLILPSSWIRARCDEDLRLYRELLEQSRIQEARDTLRDLLLLDPRFTEQGTSLRSELHLLTHQISRLEQSVSRPVPGNIPAAEGIERARILAMLARIPEAQALLESELLKNNPESLVMRGRIHENQDEWLTAIEYYNQAEGQLMKSSVSPDRELRDQLLLGRAFCSRRLGRLTNAEADYLQLLQSSPSPGNHFLLALFYDDVQNAPAALKHALAAQKLDSRNFGEAGRQLIRNLQDSHFGCFSVYWKSR
jgi:hypothetical protein